MTTAETVYTNAFSATSAAWTPTGASPYLNDSDANYVNTSTNGLLDSYWTFAASVGSGVINSVKLRFEVYSLGATNGFNLEVWDGAAWIDVGPLLAPSPFGWIEKDVSAVLTTWAKIDGCRARITSIIVSANAVWVRRLTRKVEFTIPSIYTVEPSYFNAVKRRFSEAIQSHPTFEVTLNSLILGAADSITGWYAKSYTQCTINMIIVQKEYTAQQVQVGHFVSLDAVGLTPDTLLPYDVITDSFTRDWLIETVKPVVIGEKVAYFVCDLREMPLNG